VPEACRCAHETVVLGIRESDAYSKHMKCVVMGELVGRYSCPVTGTIWKRVWGIGLSHGAGPARMELVKPGDEAEAFRYGMAGARDCSGDA
jgi:hypothetical protein